MSKTILVVDDDKEVLSMVQTVLEESGYRVITAEDAKACMRELVVKKPDLIVMDLRLPNMDGFNAIDMMRVTQLTQRIPIIMWSGFADDELMRKAERLGADDYMSKSIPMPEFARRIASHFFSIEHSLLPQLLKQVRPAADGTPLPVGIDIHRYAGWLPHPLHYGELELCLLLAKGVTPTEATSFNLVDAKQKIAVFRKLRYRWKQLWPQP